MARQATAADWTNENWRLKHMVADLNWRTDEGDHCKRLMELVGDRRDVTFAMGKSAVSERRARELSLIDRRSTVTRQRGTRSCPTQSAYRASCRNFLII
jgi:hypothetical protein